MARSGRGGWLDGWDGSDERRGVWGSAVPGPPDMPSVPDGPEIAEVPGVDAGAFRDAEPGCGDRGDDTAGMEGEAVMMARTRASVGVCGTILALVLDVRRSGSGD